MTPEPVLRFTGELVDGAATSADVGEEDDDVVETEDDGSQHQRRHDHPDTAGGRQAPPPASHRCRSCSVVASVARLTPHMAMSLPATVFTAECCATDNNAAGYKGVVHCESEKTGPCNYILNDFNKPGPIRNNFWCKE